MTNLKFMFKADTFRISHYQQQTEIPIFKLFCGFGHSKTRSAIAKYMIFYPYLWGSFRVKS